VRVLNRALDDLERLLQPRQARYPIILDVGCGQGMSLLELPKRFGADKLIAVDVDAHSIDAAKEKAKHCEVPVQWHCANASVLRWPMPLLTWCFAISRSITWLIKNRCSGVFPRA